MLWTSVNPSRGRAITQLRKSRVAQCTAQGLRRGSQSSSRRPGMRALPVPVVLSARAIYVLSFAFLSILSMERQTATALGLQCLSYGRDLSDPAAELAVVCQPGNSAEPNCTAAEGTPAYHCCAWSGNSLRAGSTSEATVSHIVSCQQLRRECGPPNAPPLTCGPCLFPHDEVSFGLK